MVEVPKGLLLWEFQFASVLVWGERWVSSNVESLECMLPARLPKNFAKRRFSPFLFKKNLSHQGEFASSFFFFGRCDPFFRAAGSLQLGSARILSSATSSIFPLAGRDKAGIRALQDSPRVFAPPSLSERRRTVVPLTRAVKQPFVRPFE